MAKHAVLSALFNILTKLFTVRTSNLIGLEEVAAFPELKLPALNFVEED